MTIQEETANGKSRKNNTLPTTGRLYGYLQDIDTQANEQLAPLIRQLENHRANESQESKGMGQKDEQHPEPGSE